MTRAPVDQPNEEELALHFVDTHCHLDDAAFANDIDDVIEQSRQAGVFALVNVGFNPATWTSTIELAKRHRAVSSALGMHPQDAASWNPKSSSMLTHHLNKHRPVAIGEIGIDLFRNETNLARQLMAFDEQLDLALEHKLPVIIHMRSAQNEVLTLLRSRSVNPNLMFHSFDGTEELTSYINESGSMVGVGGLATRAKSVTIRQQLLEIPLTQMALETDSPYLVPAKSRGSRNTPLSIPIIATFLADLMDQPLYSVAMTTTANAERFFGELGTS